MADEIHQLIEDDDYLDVEDSEQYKKTVYRKKWRKVEDYLEKRKLKEMLKEDPFY